MWLDQLIMDIQEQEMLLFDAQIEFERMSKIHREFTEGGREYLLKKYRNSNLTYVYRYLNSNAYEDSKNTYEYVKNRYEHMQRTLYLIQLFHPDGDLINPRYYKSEEEREWEDARNIKKSS